MAEKPAPQLRLRASIVLAVVLGLMLPVTIASLFTLRHREEALTQQLQTDHQRLTEILALGIQEPLWNLDKAAGQRLLDSLIRDERVVSLVVRDKNLGTFLTNEYPARRQGRQFNLERAIQRNHNTIGFASVEVDSGRLDAVIAGDRQIFLFTVAAQLVLSVVLILALLQVRLLRPINRLMHESDKLAHRELDDAFVWERRDELGNLGHSLERTRLSLRSLFAELETKNLQLNQDIERRMQVEHELQREIGDRERAETRIRYLAQHDVLTDLPNLLWFRERLNLAIAEAQEKQTLTAALLIDLDRFKNVNDALGHQAGDQLLRGVAQRLQYCMGEHGTVARIGGDEFVINLPALRDASAILLVSTKILEELRQPFRVGNHDLHVGGSIGISVFPTDGADADALLRAADAAMYHAKAKGRDNYQFFTSSMQQDTQRRLHIANSFHQGLRRKEFLLHYQPQVDLESGRIFGAEALVRWQQPGGMVPPGEFIRIAEETGFVVRLGEWVLREACAQAAQWRKTDHADLRIAVNLSPQQFQRPGFPALVSRILHETGLPPNALELEITEGVLTMESPENMATLEQLAAMGIELAIDDFGTGYSSLSYLQRFPIHALKIDQSFVAGIARDANDTAIVTAIIAMAHSLRLKVVAEGVETIEQAAFLKSRGCLAAQGYYFSRPIADAALVEMLRKPAEPPLPEPSSKSTSPK
jgi:diguanylate cyclase (GGDEF)-like protein